MKKILILAVVIYMIAAFSACTESKHGTLEEPRNTELFDFGWKFHYGDLEKGQSVSMDTESWKVIDLPHDWSIEDLPGTDSPLDSLAPGGIDYGYFTGGTSWYRKEFTLEPGKTDARIFIQFDGVYMNCDVWLNGQFLGNHPYGYTSFTYDITGQADQTGKNVLAVKVNNEGVSSRWYPGSGINRHVWLIRTGGVHFTPWSLLVDANEFNREAAKVRVRNSVNNSTGMDVDAKVHTVIFDPEGRKAGVSDMEIKITAGHTGAVIQEVELEKPEAWSVDNPALYRVVSSIEVDGKVSDRVEDHFGIRSIALSGEGFLLNGENILMKGGCVHDNNGPLGSAAYDRADERRVELLKAAGFNAIRCAHNPPSPAFLDACDRLGMLVIDEAFDMWNHPKRPQDYSRFFMDHWEQDLGNMVMRDYNHPSVVMWSTGNEIPERGDREGVETAAMLTEFIKKIDPYRPVTSAVNGLTPDKDPFFAVQDAAGYNYPVGVGIRDASKYLEDHERVPGRIMYCSESYPLEAFGSWMAVLDLPYVFGDFVWTSFDYLGEASIGWLGYLHRASYYPWNHAFCGDIDICGFKRPQSYYRDALWNNRNALSVFVVPPVPSYEILPGKEDWSLWHWQDVVADWNWKGYEGQPLDIEVYCSHPEVELFLNGKSLGKQECSRENEWIARWKVAWEAGELKAVARNKQGTEFESRLVTAGEPVSIELHPDRTELLANSQDLSFITVELKDGNGNIHPKAENLVRFEIEGPGEILAVSSSNPKSPESYRSNRRKAYQGKCLVIVKTTPEEGEIRIKATSDGLTEAGSVLKSVYAGD